jgi:hypothetical protein
MNNEVEKITKYNWGYRETSVPEDSRGERN